MKKWITISIGVLLVLFFIFNEHGLIKRIEINLEIKQLKAQKEYYLKKIAEDSTLLENLKCDIFLEKYARERYLMKRENETIYLINK